MEQQNPGRALNWHRLPRSLKVLLLFSIIVAFCHCYLMPVEAWQQQPLSNGPLTPTIPSTFNVPAYDSLNPSAGQNGNGSFPTANPDNTWSQSTGSSATGVASPGAFNSSNNFSSNPTFGNQGVPSSSPFGVNQDSEIDRGARQDSNTQSPGNLPASSLLQQQQNLDSRVTARFSESGSINQPLSNPSTQFPNQQDQASPANMSPTLGQPPSTLNSNPSFQNRFAPSATGQTGNGITNNGLGGMGQTATGNGQASSLGYPSAMRTGNQGEMTSASGLLPGDTPRYQTNYGDMTAKQGILGNLDTRIPSNSIVNPAPAGYEAPETPVSRRLQDADTRLTNAQISDPQGGGEPNRGETTGNDATDSGNIREGGGSLQDYNQALVLICFVLLLICVFLGVLYRESRQNYRDLADELHERFFREMT